MLQLGRLAVDETIQFQNLIIFLLSQDCDVWRYFLYLGDASNFFIFILKHSLSLSLSLSHLVIEMNRE